MEFSPWTLWYHDPDCQDYSLASYSQVGEVGTPAQFWTIVNSIPKDAWENGMFFFMKKGVRPTWDSPENEKGGAWSKKIEASDTHEVFVDLMVHCVTGKLLQSHKEILQGITVSPKGAFHIVKIWNSNASQNDRKFITPTSRFRVGDDVTYTPHKLRPR
jgi:hypothetical protein